MILAVWHVYLRGERMAGTREGNRRFSFSSPFSLGAGMRGMVSNAAHCTCGHGLPESDQAAVQQICCSCQAGTAFSSNSTHSRHAFTNPCLPLQSGIHSC